MNIPFHITPTTSVFKNDFSHAFSSDNPGADTLIVDPGAYLISVNNNGALLANTGAWTVTINGSIVSQTTTGINLLTGNAAVSTIKIGVDGEVQGGFDGIFLGSSANINNAGTIVQTVVGGIGIAIQGGGTHTITNSGEIITVVGSAAIEVFGTSNDTVKNSGTIKGPISFSDGNDTVTNSGVLSNGDLSLGDGTNHLTNSGVISDDIIGGSGADTLTNSNLINNFVLLGDGTNSLINSGKITGDVGSGSGADTVTDFAIVGDVMKSGTIGGPISLGDGNDKFTGGANPETVLDGNGADIVSLGGGNDTYSATGNTGTDGNDIVKGGTGVDTYDASAATTDCQINLDTVAHTHAPFNPSTGLVAANTATGTDISGSAKDTITGFENANGGAGADLIYGTAAANTLSGGNGNDVLFGFGGNDTLVGGAANDILFGGPGKDQLTGGSGTDAFVYAALSDSGITSATRDLVADFQQGVDVIDINFIDANTTNAAGTNDAFNFVGTNIPTGFSGNPGELHAFWSAIGQIVEGDVNGDKKADFSIEIADPTHAITLTNASFNL